jgi:hypothetical protein
MTDHGALLHNMSSPPRSVVKYDGLGVSVPQGAVSEDATVDSYRAPNLFGVAVRFVLPVGMARKGPRALLKYLDIKVGADPDQQLSAQIDQRADELPLPDGCLVVPVEPGHQMIWSDTLDVLAILAKCSASVWLRAKTPSVRSALARKRVSLLVPPTFIDKLPKAEL